MTDMHEFANSISHQSHSLNNYLTAILGYTELILETTQPDDPVYAYADEILDAGRNAKIAIDHLRLLRRIATAKAQQSDVGKLISRYRSIMRESIADSIDFQVDTPHTTLFASVGSNDLEAILLALCDAGAQAINKEGTIRLEACIDNPDTDDRSNFDGAQICISLSASVRGKDHPLPLTRPDGDAEMGRPLDLNDDNFAAVRSAARMLGGSFNLCLERGVSCRADVRLPLL
jgi:signal transduction histidine kinase